MQPLRYICVESGQDFGQVLVVFAVETLQVLLCLGTHGWVRVTFALAEAFVLGVAHHLAKETFLWVVPEEGSQ